jgi:hypothetical protein
MVDFIVLNYWLCVRKHHGIHGICRHLPHDQEVKGSNPTRTLFCCGQSVSYQQIKQMIQNWHSHWMSGIRVKSSEFSVVYKMSCEPNLAGFSRGDTTLS